MSPTRIGSRGAAAILVLALAGPLSGCAVVTVAGAVAGAAITVTATVVTTTVKVAGQAVGAVVDAVRGTPPDAAPAPETAEGAPRRR